VRINTRVRRGWTAVFSEHIDRRATYGREVLFGVQPVVRFGVRRRTRNTDRPATIVRRCFCSARNRPNNRCSRTCRSRSVRPLAERTKSSFGIRRTLKRSTSRRLDGAPLLFSYYDGPTTRPRRFPPRRRQPRSPDRPDHS